MAIQMKKSDTTSKWTLVAVLVGIAFFGSYSYATAKSVAAKSGNDVLAGPASATASAAGGGGGCCGGGSSAPASALVPKAADVVGGVQKVSVDVSKGYYDPSVIELQAGIPAEITFSQSSGCTGSIQSADLGFSEDLSNGPKTVKLDGLQAGTYGFACGMNMVTGSIVVK